MYVQAARSIFGPQEWTRLDWEQRLLLRGKLLAHLAGELDKDAQELRAGLTAGKLPPWVCQPPHTPE